MGMTKLVIYKAKTNYIILSEVECYTERSRSREQLSVSSVLEKKLNKYENILEFFDHRTTIMLFL